MYQNISTLPARLSKTLFATLLLACCCVLISAKPANQTSNNIYARLEPDLNPAQGDIYGCPTDYYQTVNLDIHFYSDDACTTPVTLPSNVSYSISYTGYLTLQSGTQNFSGTYTSGTATAGNSVWQADLATWEGLLVNDNCVQEEKYRQDYELASIGGGIIIKPTVNPSHLPGF